MDQPRKPPSATEIADLARLLRQPAKPTALPRAVIPPHEQTKVGPLPRLDRPKDAQAALASAQSRARAANESIRDSRTELLSEPESSAPNWNDEPVTSPESPQGRLSLADFEAFQQWQRARHAPVEPTPPQSIAPKSSTRRVEWGISQNNLDFLKWLAGMLIGAGLVGGTVVTKDALDAPKEQAAASEAKAARDGRVRALEGALADERKARYEFDVAMTAWLSGVLPPLGVKIVYDKTAPAPPEPVELQPAPTPDPHRVRGKQAPPVQPPPIPVPVPPQ